MKNNPRSLTLSHLKILDLLSLTMVSTSMLIDGGIFYSPGGKLKTSLRNAQKTLQNLHKAGYIRFVKYPIIETGRFQRFYFLTDHTFKILGKEDRWFHKVSSGLVDHDSLTALFLVHIFRCCTKRGISLRWHPAFEIDDKKCDGALTLAKDGKITHSFIIETDTGTHDHREIREKFQTYLECLAGHPERKILFLVSGTQRKNNLKVTLQEVLREKNIEHSQGNIAFLCPRNFSPVTDLFQKESNRLTS